MTAEEAEALRRLAEEIRDCEEIPEVIRQGFYQKIINKLPLEALPQKEEDLDEKENTAHHHV